MNAAGNEPVRDWLHGLPVEDKKTIGADILAVQWAWPVGKPLVDSLGGGLWEVRSSLEDRIARTFFIIVHQEIILLHGIIKNHGPPPNRNSISPGNAKPFTSNKSLQAMKTKTAQNAHRGSDFRDFLAEEGILPAVEVLALKRTVAIQLQQILESEHVTKTQLAARMKTSRASLDRLLDPMNPSLTVASLGKAAAALGRKVELRFVPA